MNFRLIPYNMASGSCKALQAALRERGHRALRVNRNSSTYNYRQSHNVINWGCSGINSFTRLNMPRDVQVASNKLDCLSHLEDSGVVVPKYTTDVFEATTWCQEGHTIVERHLLNSHSGRGIRIVSDPLDIQHAPLYTIYQKKTAEYRVHVLPTSEQCYHHSHDRPVIINQKRRRHDVPNEEVNWQIRNHDNGFVYCRDNVDDCPGLIGLAVRAVEALCLDFGAVDILYHAPTETMLVLEVNTAPGLAGSLVDDYADAFVKAFGG